MSSKERDIIVHYHLFKNAGTSVDHILRKNFGDSWYGFDGEKAGNIITCKQLEETIASNTDKVAFSSHQIVPPLPSVDGSVYPIVFLRDPIDRLKSSYLFEWKKQLGLDFPKASLKDYVQEKFKFERKNPVEDFQTIRLSNADRDTFTGKQSSDEQMLEKSCEFIASLSFVGIVDEFAGSMQLLSSYLGEAFPEFQVSDVKANVLQDVSMPISDKQKKIREELGGELYELVVGRNALDTQLYNFAKNHYQYLLKERGIDKSINEAVAG